MRSTLRRARAGLPFGREAERGRVGRPRGQRHDVDPLAAQMQKFKGLPTISGKVSFSPTLHSVFGRQYRVMQIQNNKAKYVGAVTAKVVPKI